MTLRTKNLIIGGGFSGLIMASRLDESFLITEDLGGLIASFDKGAYKFDIGGHVYTSKDPRVVELMKRSGGVFFPERKTYYIDSNAKGELKTVEYPVQMHPDQIGSSIEPMKALTEIYNLEDYLIQQFGINFYFDFLKPFNTRVWSTSPKDMDWDWIEGRIQLPTEDKKDWGMNSSFYYAPGEVIISNLLDDLGTKARIETGSLQALDVGNHKALFINNTVGVGEIQYENLFITTNYFVPNLRRNKILTIGVGLNKMIDVDFHWMYANLQSQVHRITLLSRYHPLMAPVGVDSLLFEIPFIDPMSSEVSRLSHFITHTNKSLRVTSAKDVIGMAGFEHIVDYKDIEEVFSKITYGYPVPTLHSRRYVAMTKMELLPNDVYLLGRWGAHGYFNLQHIYQDVDTVAEQMDLARDHAFSKRYLESSFYYKR